MTPQSIDLIFWDAVQLPDERRRNEYLDQACGDNAELRGRVEQLLAARGEAVDFLEKPAPGLPGLVATLDEQVAERPGTVIGPYKLLEQIGEGGFGVVFMAEQQQPVRRKVALKVIKPGMDTRQVIARFEAERQALALMDHPNIARVLDAGTTESEPRTFVSGSGLEPLTNVRRSGRPFFVMELVRGLSMTEYCDQNNLPIRERLDLFVDVCRAVQHAHQKGIIHRDIKPSNVLVTLHDGNPVVKVIDFGIAKAMGQEPLTDKTLFTNFAQMIGTPLYMSPEQAEMSGLDVDTRSDIYSLGVLLYELLTGTTPFDKERLKTASFDEVRRILLEEEPPKPSTRMSEEVGRFSKPSCDALRPTGVAATTASEKRRSDPLKLSRLLRGELDWIVMKALEKDRNRRYESASALAADVEPSPTSSSRNATVERRPLRGIMERGSTEGGISQSSGGRARKWSRCWPRSSLTPTSPLLSTSARTHFAGFVHGVGRRASAASRRLPCGSSPVSGGRLRRCRACWRRGKSIVRWQQTSVSASVR
jgi:serine/threonine protein kinase